VETSEKSKALQENHILLAENKLVEEKQPQILFFAWKTPDVKMY
jgi:hypothetical protein